MTWHLKGRFVCSVVLSERKETRGERKCSLGKQGACSEGEGIRGEKKQDKGKQDSDA